MAKLKCEICFSNELKEVIKKAVKDPAVIEQIDKIKTCEPGTLQLQLCQGKRRSAFQEFMSRCMKAKHLKGIDPAAMQECRREWKEEKAQV